LLQGSGASARARARMMQASAPWGRPLAVSLAGVTIVALSGGLATEIGPWYQALRKPAFQPPDWLFGPAWTLIFLLTAIAAADCWRKARSDADRRWIVLVFTVNGILNVVWSVLFFKLRRPDWALGEVVLLWVSIVSLMIVARPLSTRALVLLAPYLAWVS